MLLLATGSAAQAQQHKNSKEHQDSSPLGRRDIHNVRAKSDAFYNSATGTLMLLQSSVYVLVHVKTYQ